jgi:hypothetical protein
MGVADSLTWPTRLPITLSRISLEILISLDSLVSSLSEYEI